MNEAERYLRDLRNKSAEPASNGGMPRGYPPSLPGGASSRKYQGVLNGWWSLEGRLGRKIYILRQLLIVAAMLVAMTVLNVVGAHAGAYELLGRPIAAMVIFGSMPFALPQHTRRLHDLGWSGWMQLLFWVPIFGVFFRIFLWCKPGMQGRNPYG